MGERTISVTKRRTRKDFVIFVKDVLGRYPKVSKLHIVAGNLSPHFPGSFAETFGEEETRCILKRIEFHYTPSMPEG